jgi:two-component system, response regulator RegA
MDQKAHSSRETVPTVGDSDGQAAARNSSIAPEGQESLRIIAEELDQLEHMLRRLRRLVADAVRESHEVRSPPRTSGPSPGFAPENRRVLLVDRPGRHQTRMVAEFEARGYQVEQVEPGQAMKAVERQSPGLIVTEMRFDPDHRKGSNLIGRLCRTAPAVPLVVLSDSISIAATVWAIRCGAAAVLPKPASAEQVMNAVLDAQTSDDDSAATYFSLERAKWEYLSQTLQECGSIAAAARRLKIHPRSLRRMLAKSPVLK